MTNQEKRTAIKRLNERYTEMARKFGPDSVIVRRFEKDLRAVFGADAMHKAKPQVKLNAKKASKTSVSLKGKTRAKKTKDVKIKEPKLTASEMGLSLITRSPEVLGRVSDQELNALLKKETAGRIQRDLEKEARFESDLSGTEVTVKDLVSAMDYISELDDNDPEFYEAVKFYWDEIAPGHTKGKKTGKPRPSYKLTKDLLDGKKEAKDQRAAKNDQRADNIEDQLRFLIRKHDEDYNPFEVFE